MILDQLFEKKDLKIYIEQRIAYLNNKLAVEMGKVNPKDREKLHQRHIGRVRELNNLRIIIEQDRLKIMGKIYWEKLNAIYKIP